MRLYLAVALLAAAAMALDSQDGRAISQGVVYKLAGGLARPASTQPSLQRYQEQELDESNQEEDDDEDDEDEEEEETETVETTQRSQKKPEPKSKRKYKKKKLKGLKKFKKFLLPLLLAYKLKFLMLIPLLFGGLVLLVGTTGFAGFFFALFAVGLSLRRD